VAAGSNGSATLASAELYNPWANTWSAINALLAARQAHSATLLPDSRVLVVGGYGLAGAPLKSAEIYDPATDAWSAAASLATARASHTATLLPNGSVLVTDGSDASGAALSNGGIYDPASDRSSRTGPLMAARTYHSAVLLPSGKVLIAGGESSPAGFLDTSELFSRSLRPAAAWRPVVTAAPSISLGSALTISGRLFSGLSEASGGNGVQNSSTNHPIAVLQSLGNEQRRILGASDSVAWSSAQLTTAPIADFPAGPARLTVVVNGIPSVTRAVGVSRAPSTVALTTTPDPSQVAQAVTLTASVTGVSPTGTVQFKDGTARIGIPVALSGGVATLSKVFASAGDHQISAVYSGDMNNLPVTSGVVTQTVK